MKELEKLNLRTYQNKPQLLSSLSIEELAWLAHEAEFEEDDITQMHIDSLLMSSIEIENFLSAYRESWTRHAKFRGYHARACGIDTFQADLSKEYLGRSQSREILSGSGVRFYIRAKNFACMFLRGELS